MYADLSVGNERLQEMMGIMARERKGEVFATDERSECPIHPFFIRLITISQLLH